MYRMLVVVAVAGMLGGCATMGDVRNPKQAACRQSCESSADECRKKAGDDAAKKVACDASKQECMKACNK